MRNSVPFRGLLPVNDDSSDLNAMVSWLSDPKNNLNLQEVKEIALPHFQNGFRGYLFLWKWLEEKENNCELQDVKEILTSLSDSIADNHRMVIIKTWLDKEENNLELKDVVEILHFFQDDDEKRLLIKNWIAKNQNGLTPNNLRAVLLGWDDPHDGPLVKELLKSRNSPEDFKKVLPLLSTKFLNTLLVSEWLKEAKERPEINDFKEILSLIDGDKKDLINEWIAKDPEQKYSTFVAAVDKDWLCNRYDYQVISQSYSSLNLPIKNLPDLCRQLYPRNELFQVELFSEFVKENRLKGEEGKSLLKSFVGQLQSNEEVLALLTSANRKESLRLPELEILELASNRLGKKYESIKEELGGKSLLESLTPEGLATVKELFGQGEGDSALQQKTLADLFSYYDVKNQIVSFKSVVKPEILQEIAAAYEPSSKSPYLAKEEYEKLQQLFNNVAHPESKLELPEVKILADYLQSKVPVIPPVNVEQFQFGESEVLSAVNEEDAKAAMEQETITEESARLGLQHQKKSKITKDFKKLLTDGNAAQNLEVAKFFYETLGVESKIDESSQKKLADYAKLADFFRANQKELAFLFQQKGGLDKFVVAIAGLGDGCVANIATQAKIALYQSIITDPCDQILFAAFHEKISTPILNSGGDHLGGSAEGTNIFTNKSITDSLISPAGLVATLQEQFRKDGGKGRDPWETVSESKTLAGKRHELLEKTLQTTDPSAEATKIAAYVVLEKTVPELLNSKYLTGLRSLAELKVEVVASNPTSDNPNETTPNTAVSNPTGVNLAALVRGFCKAISGRDAKISPSDFGSNAR